MPLFTTARKVGPMVSTPEKGGGCGRKEGRMVLQTLSCVDVSRPVGWVVVRVL